MIECQALTFARVALTFKKQFSFGVDSAKR
jgi:hypothetical protein